MSTTENENWSGEIVLTPDYEYIFDTMLRDALAQSDPLTLFDFLSCKRQAKALRAVQRLLVPLNIACQCMTNRQAVERFREALNAIVQEIDKTAGLREEQQAEREA